ncbi:DUF4132 domain-containing protein [bacterium]|nr:DUF4132 domain-containing protein [bacterium]
MQEIVERILAQAGPNARATANQFMQQLEGDAPPAPVLPGSWYSPGLRQAISDLFVHPQLSATMALQAACLCGDLLARSRPAWVMPEALENFQRWWEFHGKACDLNAFAQKWKASGNAEHDFLKAFSDEPWGRPWPQLELDFLRSYLGQQQDYLLKHTSRWTALRLLTRLESPPAEVLECLWECALDEPRKERELAQAWLSRSGRFEERLLTGLRHGQACVRQRAAEWAGRLRLSSALKPLTEVLAKEKVERTRMAQMEALRALGAPLDLYLNRTGLLSDARKRLQKEPPAWLAQVPPAELRWKADDRVLEEDLVKGWMLAAVALKQPQPTGLFSLVAPYLVEESREDWGLELLNWWIVRDTRPTYSPDQIEILWPQQAAALKNLYGMLKISKSEQALESEARRQLEQSVEGSAIELKGLLALAGAFGGRKLLEPVQRYLKTWYGLRAAQCKALLCMLGYVEGKEVVLYLLEVARRFRTKGIQQEAERVLRERAERSGWTLEELADLSIPSGGLDEQGQLHLEFEERTVVASLLPDLGWQLQDSTGRLLKTLPSSQDKLPGTLFKAAQKAVKEVPKSLRERLYEAMCCARSWSYSAWDTSLRRHPIAARLVQSLVWLARQEGRQVSFRADLDGSILSADQDCLELNSACTIQLAHPLLLDQAELAAWQQHLADYRLIPCFAQLSRAVFVKPPVESGEFAYYGHLLNSFKLRNRAQGLGYQRAPAQDGGVFDVYRKSLVSSGWSIGLRFSGSALPETSHPVAMLELNFEHQGSPARWPDIPPVLYSEAMADAQEMALEGSGFDPDWQRKACLS